MSQGSLSKLSGRKLHPNASCAGFMEGLHHGKELVRGIKHERNVGL